MAAPPAVVQAVQAAILASAHLAAYEHVSAAAQACRRLGSMTSGRWRSVARDLDGLEDELQTAFANSAEAVTERATSLGLSEETLWTVGDAAATLDLLREAALDELDEDSPAEKLLQGSVLFGASFVEDPDLPDRGTTLLFAWPEPLSPATWSWQANWVVGDGQDKDERRGRARPVRGGRDRRRQPHAGRAGRRVELQPRDARAALRDAALALTRASLLAGVEDSRRGATTTKRSTRTTSSERGPS